MHLLQLLALDGHLPQWNAFEVPSWWNSDSSRLSSGATSSRKPSTMNFPAQPDFSFSVLSKHQWWCLNSAALSKVITSGFPTTLV